MKHILILCLITFISIKIQETVDYGFASNKRPYFDLFQEIENDPNLAPKDKTFLLHLLFKQIYSHTVKQIKEKQVGLEKDKKLLEKEINIYKKYLASRAKGSILTDFLTMRY
jgi:hypothetical protein